MCSCLDDGSHGTISVANSSNSQYSSIGHEYGCCSDPACSASVGLAALPTTALPFEHARRRWGPHARNCPLQCNPVPQASLSMHAVQASRSALIVRCHGDKGTEVCRRAGPLFVRGQTLRLVGLEIRSRDERRRFSSTNTLVFEALAPQGPARARPTRVAARGPETGPTNLQNWNNPAGPFP